jgi:hypothetical protein
VGLIFLLNSIYQAIILKEPHFYSLFSVGIFIIFYLVYNHISEKNLFEKWSLKGIIVFAILLLGASILFDNIGLKLGYWIYPHYGLVDNFRKYIFEWAIALFYHTLTLMIGYEIFKKIGMKKTTSFILSLIIFVTIIGLITEFLNIQMYSWKVLSMPITNYKIGNFFIVFQTIGYWLMAIIPYIIYYLVDKSKWK